MYGVTMNWRSVWRDCALSFLRSPVPYLSVYPRRPFAIYWSVLPGIHFETD